MNVDKVKKRRLVLLGKLMKLARGRHDVTMPLSQIAPTLNIVIYNTGARFVDKENPLYEGGSDLSYDFTTLLQERLIKWEYIDHESDGMGGFKSSNPGVKLTLDGLEVSEDYNKSWLTHAIEKQPMTFLQIIVTLVIALVSFVGGLALGRYVIPINKEVSQPAISMKQQVMTPNANKSINNK